MITPALIMRGCDFLYWFCECSLLKSQQVRSGGVMQAGAWLVVRSMKNKEPHKNGKILILDALTIDVTFLNSAKGSRLNFSLSTASNIQRPASSTQWLS